VELTNLVMSPINEEGGDSAKRQRSQVTRNAKVSDMIEHTDAGRQIGLVNVKKGKKKKKVRVGSYQGGNEMEEVEQQ